MQCGVVFLVYVIPGNFKEKRRVLKYIEANNLYGWCLSPNLPYTVCKITNINTIKNVIKTTNDSNISHAVDVNGKNEDFKK